MTYNSYIFVYVYGKGVQSGHAKENYVVKFQG